MLFAGPKFSFKLVLTRGVHMKDSKENKLARLVGSNIAMRRKLKKWTQAQLGEMLGIGTDSVCRIERGVTAPRFQRIEDIAHLLGCSVADLFKTPEEQLQSALCSQNADSADTQLDVSSQIARLSEQILLLTKLLSKNSTAV